MKEWIFAIIFLALGLSFVGAMLFAPDCAKWSFRKPTPEEIIRCQSSCGEYSCGNCYDLRSYCVEWESKE